MYSKQWSQELKQNVVEWFLFCGLQIQFKSFACFVGLIQREPFLQLFFGSANNYVKTNGTHHGDHCVASR